MSNKPNIFSQNDERFMRRALELAILGKGHVSPNPMVGCVIVHNGKIIGEGWHRQYGEAHAEVRAIESVKHQKLLTESTLYVTLEPCAHFGKTPPCADLIVKHKIPKVVICNTDPFSEVDGKGIARLRQHGTEVLTGLLENEGRHLNRRFFTSIEKKRPYILLKWAQTADGFVARKNFDSKWISNPQSRRLVHKLRAEEDAILVGYNTAKYDNPMLTTRDWPGKNPLRLVMDRDMELNRDLLLFNGEANTVVFSTHQGAENDSVECAQIDFTQPEEEILRYLQKRNIQSVLIEGGSATLQGFIEKGLWDEAHVFVSQTTFEDGIAAPQLSGTLENEQNIAGDRYLQYRNG